MGLRSLRNAMQCWHFHASPCLFIHLCCGSPFLFETALHGRFLHLPPRFPCQAVLCSTFVFSSVPYCFILFISLQKKRTAPTALMFSSHLVRWRALARSLLCFWLVLGLSHDWGKSLQHVHNPILAPKVLSMPAGTQRIEW